MMCREDHTLFTQQNPDTPNTKIMQASSPSKMSPNDAVRAQFPLPSSGTLIKNGLSNE